MTSTSSPSGAAGQPEAPAAGPAGTLAPAMSGAASHGAEVAASRMSPEQIATYLRDRLEDQFVGHVVAYGQLTVTVAPTAVPIAVQLCRDDPRLDFDFFDFLTAVDEREDGFGVVIHLYSLRHRHHIQIRALADGGRAEPRLPTISHLYRGANWHEREAYDMFGITFDGHPGLLPRILTVENFEGFPLRKEFLLMSREVKPWPGLKEPKEQEDEDTGDGEGTAPSGPSAEDKARMAREKAERAKAKAAEARKRRAQERAEAQADDATGPAATTDAADQVGDEKRAAAAGAGEDESASDPQRAAAVADDAIAKDAAAGAVGGDTTQPASGDEPGDDQPRPDDTPGEDPSLASDEIGQAFQDEDGGRGLPPRGSTDEEPRGLEEGGVDTVPLDDEQDVEVSPPVADRQEERRPIGTDADDRIRRLEDDHEDSP